MPLVTIRLSLRSSGNFLASAGTQRVTETTFQSRTVRVEGAWSIVGSIRFAIAGAKADNLGWTLRDYPDMAFTAAQARRRGTWGWGHFFLLMLLLGAVLGGFYFFAYQWAFYLGGTFHVFPMWQGAGKAHTKSGDYLLYVLIYPETRNMKTYLRTNITGTANICTPRGEDIFLVLGGGMRRHLNVSTDGEEIGFYVHRRSWSGGSPQAAPPRLEFHGQWRNPNLVIDDQGTIAKAFLPDGTVAPDRNRNYSNAPEVVPITLSQGSVSDYRSACNAMRK